MWSLDLKNDVNSSRTCVLVEVPCEKEEYKRRVGIDGRQDVAEHSAAKYERESMGRGDHAAFVVTEMRSFEGDQEEEEEKEEEEEEEEEKKTSQKR
jgi:hypothetical protein